MAYKVIDSGWQKEFSGWWDLIGYLKDKEYAIAHNDNDLYIYYDCGTFKLKPSELSYEDEIVKKTISFLMGENDYKEIKRYIYKRDLFVYDDYNKLVNLHEIRESISILKPKKDKKWRWFRDYFRYRYDPVPGISVYRRNRFRKVKRNKSYAAKLSEYVDLFPNDSSIKRSAFFVSRWDDDFSYRKTEKNWKRQSKKAKQWMK